MCTKLCRKKGFDVLVIMNVFRESMKRGEKKRVGKGTVSGTEVGPGGGKQGHSPEIISHDKQHMNGHELLKHSGQVAAHPGPTSPLLPAPHTSILHPKGRGIFQNTNPVSSFPCHKPFNSSPLTKE